MEEEGRRLGERDERERKGDQGREGSLLGEMDRTGGETGLKGDAGRVNRLRVEKTCERPAGEGLWLMNKEEKEGELCVEVTECGYKPLTPLPSLVLLPRCLKLALQNLLHKQFWHRGCRLS